MSYEHSPNIIYLATRNQHKAEELHTLLSPLGFQVRGCLDVAPDIRWDETGTTFLENARIKAHALRTVISDFVLADDSGLEVEALDQAPGVQSACYAGTDGDHQANNEKLIRELRARHVSNSRAQFRCTLLLLDPNGTEHIFEGLLKGQIVTEYAGTGGFGYDPYFIPDGYSNSLATMDIHQKNAISHRGLAVAKLIQHLKDAHHT